MYEKFSDLGIQLSSEDIKIETLRYAVPSYP